MTGQAYKGTVKFRARIKGNGRTFHLLEFNPNEPGVDKVEIESSTGAEILGTVHLAWVATPEDGETIATKVHTAALNRICFFHDIAIENGHITDSAFSPVNPPPGSVAMSTGSTVLTGEQVTVVTSLSAADLKADLERPSPLGEQNFGLFRSARQSMSPVEEFMQLYHILLMLFPPDERQEDVDAFIVNEQPGVKRTQRPSPPKRRRRKPKGGTVKETVYTRLRNQLAHKRAGVNPEDTRAEMAQHLSGLIALTKRAIELHS